MSNQKNVTNEDEDLILIQDEKNFPMSIKISDLQLTKREVEALNNLRTDRAKPKGCYE